MSSKKQDKKGFTLVEAMVAVAIITIGVLGSFGYKYHTTILSLKAAAQLKAAETAEMLCESWRGTKGSSTYDPTLYVSSSIISEIEIDDTDFSHLALPTGFVPLGAYQVSLNGKNYYAVMAFKDIDTKLRALNTTIFYKPRQTSSYYSDDSLSSLLDAGNDSFKLTTLVEK